MPFQSIWQSQVTGHFQMLKSHRGHNNFGQLLKPLKKLQINRIKMEKNFPEQSKGCFSRFKWINSRVQSRCISHKIFKNFPYALKKNMLSRPFWCLAKTKISAGLSRVTGPAELIEMAQYLGTWATNKISGLVD